MSVFSRSLAFIALGGYWLASVAGSWLHDHSHLHALSNTPPADAKQSSAEHSCCSHGHCHSPATDTPAKPHHHHHGPEHDDDCTVCQLIALAPMTTMPVELPAIAEMVANTAPVSCSQPSKLLPSRFRSRAPPAV